MFDWPIWEKEVSEFPWSYDRSETGYFMRGQVIVTPDDGESVEIGRGNLVTFPAGMTCTWKILKPVEKRYSFGWFILQTTRKQSRFSLFQYEMSLNMA